LHWDAAATAFLRAVTISRICQEMFQGSDKKLAEPALHSIDSGVGSVFD